MSFRGLLNTTCNVERPTRTTDSMGGYTATWTVIHLGVSCRLFEAGTEERELYGREGVKVTHRLYIESIDGLLEDDTVIIGAAKYNVKAIKPMAGDARYLQIALERVSR